MSDVIGLDELMSQFRELVVTDEERSDIAKACAEIVAEYARDYVAVDTGELKESIEVVQDGVDANVEAGTDHAIPQEFGTSKMPAHPFMRPASDKSEDEIISLVSEAINRKLDGVA